jgi:exonuclease SbcC
MRLLSLTLEGFMPYRTRQSLDFRQVDLFALVGPTGSGKSALLDAITFALFGKTPRWHNETGAVKLTSQGMTRMSVSLEFRAGGKEYQVIRTAKRAVVEAQLRHLVDGEYRPMSSERRKTGDITADIERIVGMDYITFTRTLMLPQGQFDRLLKPGKPAERKDLLIQLAGLSVYDQLGDRLALRMRALEGDLRQVKGEMGLFESLRPERRDELEAELMALHGLRTELQQRFDGVTLQLEQLRADWRHWQLLQEARAALAPLQARAAEMHELAARLERSRQMEGQEARLQHLDQLRDEGKSLETQLAAGQAERGRLEEQLSVLQEQLEQANLNAEAIPGLQERLHELAELKESARTLADLRSEEQGLALEPLERERRELERQWNQCDLEFQRVDHELTTLGELPADLTPFQEALERARECERQLAQKAEVERELGAAQQ